MLSKYQLRPSEEDFNRGKKWQDSYEVLQYFAHYVMELIKGNLPTSVVTEIKKRQKELEITPESLIPKATDTPEKVVQTEHNGEDDNLEEKTPPTGPTKSTT